MAPTLTTQFGVLRQQVPAAIDRFEEWVRTHPNSLIASAVRSAGGPAAGAGAVGAGAAGAGATGAAGQQGAGAANTADARVARAAAQAASQTAAQTGGQQGGTAGASDDTGGAPSAVAGLRARLSGQIAGAAKFLFPFISSVGTVVAGLVLIIFLAIYIGAEPKLYHDGLMHLFPHRARDKAGEVLTETANVLRKWLVVQLIAMGVIGSVTSSSPPSARSSAPSRRSPWASSTAPRRRWPWCSPTGGSSSSRTTCSSPG
jgi:hypothetical protein